jgi:hypothetical protein
MGLNRYLILKFSDLIFYQLNIRQYFIALRWELTKIMPQKGV